MRNHWPGTATVASLRDRWYSQAAKPRGLEKIGCSSQAQAWKDSRYKVGLGIQGHGFTNAHLWHLTEGHLTASPSRHFPVLTHNLTGWAVGQLLGSRTRCLDPKELRGITDARFCKAIFTRLMCT